ncbi:MAG: HupE / UreJ protein [Gammaproteobacteria bacterium]|nr:HupE / UreJ protein [Gammaproteobacteria bacterium]|tara:strand:- start:304 stop:882 length:579 start_codon:yes stop_codon:yes gene_type:complete
MEEFKTWFFIGFDHIMDIQALDHTLFILALVVAYDSSQIKKIIFLITAFTIGHSVTLALSALELISFNQKIIEFSIPLTIFLTALNNIVNRKESKKKFVSSNYIIGLVFGLIHGLGFANYLKALLFKGNVVFELFAFNVGIEIAQIILVFVFLFLSFLFLRFVFSKREDWILFISSLIMGVSLMLISNAKFW